MATSSGPIKYGLFIMPYHPPTKPLAQCFEEDVELAIRADELGFDEFWIGEHHTMKYEPIVVPEVIIGSVLGQTERVRLGAAPICLNLHHPAYVATRLAFLDHFSKGRLNLCFGPNSVSTDMELYGKNPKEGGAMTLEAIDVILKLWASEPPYHHDGQFWQFSLEENVDEATGIGYIHKPLQQPHPPIAMPGMSRNSHSLRVAGQRGYAPFSAQFAAPNVLADNWATYATAAAVAGREADPQNWKVLRSIFLADTTKEAEQLARNNSMGANFEYIAALMDNGLGHRGILKRDLDMPDADCNMDYWMKEHIIAGDVDAALRRLLEVMEESGPFGTVVLMGYDWDDKASWLRSMELFVKELMPALNKAVSGVTV